MMDLIMLGIIPGTNIEITFIDWLRFVGSLSAVLLLLYAYRRIMSDVMRHRTAAYSTKLDSATLQQA